MFRRRSLLVLPLLGLGAAPLAAQAPWSPAVARAATTITADDVARRIAIIAHDSMGGRDTPSRGLELTARYVADQFRAFGLRPGGDSGSFLQRYAITRRQIDVNGGHIGFLGRGTHHHADLGRDAVWLLGDVPDTVRPLPVLLAAGPFGPADLPAALVRGRIVLAVVDRSRPLPEPVGAALQEALGAGAAAVVLVANRDSAAFARLAAGQARARVQVGRSARAPMVEVHERAVSAVLAGFGVDVPALRAAPAPVTREVPDLRIALDVQERVLEQSSAPNAVGILEGTDPVLKHEYVVYSAHMDHIGITPGQADSINNGADDDASGTVGVVELAEAMSKAPTKRSAIFLTVSGEEKGLWGSEHFAAHPPVPIGQVVANVNMDMIGRNWPDTIVAIGREHSDLGATLARVQAAHPELDMVAVDDRWPEERFYFRSDHYNFARRGVPILFFFNGTHEDYHRPGDEPAKIDADKESRIVRLVFWLGQEIGNARERPRWNPASRREIVGQ